MPKKQASRKTTTAATAAEAPETSKPLIELPEDEQWRLINQTGILHKVSNTTATKPNGSEPPAKLDLADEIFNSILYIIPFSFLLLLMEM
jgi:hypothetical protein